MVGSYRSALVHLKALKADNTCFADNIDVQVERNTGPCCA
jgi:hypothetical protein